jgi:hypothetical protein
MAQREMWKNEPDAITGFGVNPAFRPTGTRAYNLAGAFNKTLDTEPVVRNALS